MKRNEPCWCGSGKKWKHCCFPNLPVQAQSDRLRSYYLKNFGIYLKSEHQVQGIRTASYLAADILDELCKAAVEGVTTNELDRLSQKLHKEAGAIAAPFHYGRPPFPKTICTSLNEVICHGIPDDRPLQNGDILNIDVTSIYKGFYGDNSRMVCIGDISEEKRLVVDTSYRCLHEAISQLKPEMPVSKIGDIIEHVAAENGCSVVDQFVGHGVGLEFHEAPNVPHHHNDINIPLVSGMTFTIEPMINAGVKEAVIDKGDKWTARTADGKPSAQWEHTILITEEGYEILTLPADKRKS